MAGCTDLALMLLGTALRPLDYRYRSAAQRGASSAVGTPSKGKATTSIKKRATLIEYFARSLLCGAKLVQQFNSLVEARCAMEHVARLKRLVRQRPIGRAQQRRMRALEKAVFTMELEARVSSVRRWREPVSSAGLHRSI